MILERLLILLVILVVGAIVYMLWRIWQGTRLQRLTYHESPDIVRKTIGAQGPAILYFTAADCTQCHYRQAPILSELTQEHAITVHRLDAARQEELVRHYGIMTVPSTVILNKDLQPAAINHGLALRPHLDEQLRALQSSS
jgi:hypothetical protein